MNKKERETGIETGIGRGTGALVAEGVHLPTAAEEAPMTKWMGGRGSEAGRKMGATAEEDGTETGTATETETATEIGGIGGKSEAASTETENGGGATKGRGIEGGTRAEKESEEKRRVGIEAEETTAKGTSHGGQNGENGPRGGIRTTDWPK